MMSGFGHLVVVDNPKGRIYCKTLGSHFFQWHPRKGKYDLWKVTKGSHVWVGDTNFFEHALNWLLERRTDS